MTDAQAALTAAKARQAFYYNVGARERQPLTVGQAVRTKFNDSTDWRKAEVAKVLPHRSYDLLFEDGTHRRRTSKHVRFSPEPPITIEDQTDLAPGHEMPPNAAKVNIPTTAPDKRPQQRVTRSGRQIKTPA